MPDDDDDPFSALRKLRDSLPPGSAPASKPASSGREQKSPVAVPGAPARAVVRIERKGRGGKEATIVEKLGLSPRDLEAWVKEMKQALGCGGAVEDDAIALQGDQRDRVAEFLRRKGVGKIVRG